MRKNLYMGKQGGLQFSPSFLKGKEKSGGIWKGIKRCVIAIRKKQKKIEPNP